MKKSPSRSTYRPTGSRRARALTREQFDACLADCIARGAWRDAAIILLLAKPLRVSDLLRLRIDDLYTPEGGKRDHLELREVKTGTYRSIPLWKDGTEKIVEVLGQLFNGTLKGLPRNAYVFMASKTKSRLSSEGVFYILNQFKGKYGIETISSHSCRKTPGRFLFEAGYEIEIIAECYGHRDIRNTRTYLDIPMAAVREAQAAIMW